MIKPLEALFEKLKIKGYEDLKPHEKKTYELYEKILQTDVKVEDLKKHLNNRLELLRNLREIEGKENIPGSREDQEKLAEIRTIKGMLGLYVKTESAKKHVEEEIKKVVEKQL